jgi:uncharacterized membrane protein
MAGPDSPRPSRLDEKLVRDEADLDHHDDLEASAADLAASDGGDEDNGVSDLIARPRSSKKIASAISGRKYRKRDLVNIDELRPTLAERIRHDYPDLPPNGKISFGELARYRMLYVEELLQQEHGEFTELDRQVAESISKQDTIAENTEEEYEENRTFGERLSDKLASFGGSWSFLIYFGVFMAIWMGYNLLRGDPAAFDPYPFILLNLVLSCIAAIQAPVIMMSQNRQDQKDRQRSNNDYRVNLKAELEIRHLHEKMDYLISRQWKRLSEIQQVQLDMMTENRARAGDKAKTPKNRHAAQMETPDPSMEESGEDE